ncbi:MAG: hypothetical protein GX451_05685 [Acholeplasmataceae bacterium]|nr:hypothetical protein [Acholeplasmataceae bacterium]
MRYLITYKDPGVEPFITQWFHEGVFTPGMVVYDLLENEYTTDGKTWIAINEDCL